MLPLITLEHVTKRFTFGRETIDAIRDVSLTLFPGDTLAVTGPSGSGKSVLLSILGLLDTPTEGSHRFGGRDVARLSDDERTRLRNLKIGFVFQSPLMVERLSVLDNVALPLTYRGVEVRIAREQALEKLATVGLADRADHPPKDLSGGQLQRATIARALVGKPELVLADEPTAALDEVTSDQVMELLLELNRSTRTTLVLVTHKSADAARLGRRLALQPGAFRPVAAPTPRRKRREAAAR